MCSAKRGEAPLQATGDVPPTPGGKGRGRGRGVKRPDPKGSLPPPEPAQPPRQPDVRRASEPEAEVEPPPPKRLRRANNFADAPAPAATPEVSDTGTPSLRSSTESGMRPETPVSRDDSSIRRAYMPGFFGVGQLPPGCQMSSTDGQPAICGFPVSVTLPAVDFNGGMPGFQTVDTLSSVDEVPKKKGPLT